MPRCANMRPTGPFPSATAKVVTKPPCGLTTELSGRIRRPLRAGEHAIHREHGAAAVVADRSNDVLGVTAVQSGDMGNRVVRGHR